MTHVELIGVVILCIVAYPLFEWLGAALLVALDLLLGRE